MKYFSFLAVVAGLLLLGFAQHLDAAEAKLNYRADIRQIFSDNCFRCHGPDAESREAGLRLDVRDDALAKLESGNIAIIPGKPEESEFIRRIESNDPDEMMPPPSSRKKLTQKQKEAFRRWVAEGAEYQSHWSYATLTRPEVPAIPSSDNQTVSPIDAFVRAKLETQHIAPSPEADKRTLIRRLSLDLVGLPPTPEEVDAFVADSSTDAYEKLVDRLLASPHFGERMAVWWLDVARFTDSVGFHGDQEQRIFPYRDYVIDAFNQNMPFDQFTREQLAGDLLPQPTESQQIATGFNRLNMVTREGGAQPKEYLAKYGAERVRTIGTTWLGSTMGCCECHDHKYDPFTMRDFYALQAFFADVKQWGVYQDYNYTPNPELRNWSNDHPFPPELLVESQYLKRELARLQARKQQLLEDYAHEVNQSTQQREAFAQWLSGMQGFLQEHPSGWYELPTQTLSKSDGAKVAANTEDAAEDETKTSDAPDKPKPSNKEIRFDLPNLPVKIASLRFDFLTKDENDRPRKVERNEINVTVTNVKSGKGGRNFDFSFAKGEPHEPQYFNTHEFLGVEKTFKTPMITSGQPIHSVWQLARPLAAEKDARYEARISMSRQRTPVAAAVSPLVADDPFETANADDIQAIVSARSDAPITPQLAGIFLTGSGADAGILQNYRQVVENIRQCRGGKAYTMVTVAVKQPLTVRVLPRGNWQDESGPVVEPSVPHFLPAVDISSGQRATRLDLANWLCSSQNPLTSRAVMNRLWRAFFGTALSSAVDDLGAQGEAPSHPELLDWLATEFRDHGWDVKHMIRLVVTSQTYRQSAKHRGDLQETDPANRLLAAQSPRRLDAEFVRDNALAISGLINLEMGGPSAHPYQPAGYYANLQFPDRSYQADKDENQWRRGVYMHWQRTFLHPMLANFDAPAREECVAQRVNSNTPQQALTLLNDPEYVEAARMFSARLLAQSGDDSGKIRLAYRLALARDPREKELASLLKFLAEQRAYFAQHPDDAKKLIAIGNVSPQGHEPVEWAAWASLGRAILNLHETINRF